MRKTLLFILVLGCCYNLSAQEFKGKRFISGQFSYAPQDSQSPNFNHFNLGLGYGYYLSNRIAVGGIIRGGYNNSDREGMANLSTSLGLAPFVLFTFPLNERLAIIGEASIPFSFFSNETKYDQPYLTENPNMSNTLTTGTSVGVGLKPGVQYVINNKWNIQGFVGNFGYMMSDSKTEQIGVNQKITSETKESSIQTSLRTSIQVGIQFLF